MRVFYLIWFFVCSGWGYLMATSTSGEAWTTQVMAFPIAICTFALLVFSELRRLDLPVEFAHLSIDLKPWQQPLGVVQFTLITFIFSAAWGLGWCLCLQGTHLDHPLNVLALSSGGLLGTWSACRMYRRSVD